MAAATTNTGSALDFFGFAAEQARCAWWLRSALLCLARWRLTLSAKTKVVLGPVDMSLAVACRPADRRSLWLAARASQPCCSIWPRALPASPCSRARPRRVSAFPTCWARLAAILPVLSSMAGIVGWAADKGWDRNVLKLFGVMLVAEVVMMAMGYGWLAGIIGAEKAWQFGVLPFIVPDLIKVALAATLVPAAWTLFSGLRAGR